MKCHLLALLVIVAVLGAVYAQVSEFEFVNWDDNINVTENPHLQPPTWSQLGPIWAGPYASLYVPTAYTFYLAEAALSHSLHGELHPGVFHLGNLVLHLAATCLVYVLARRFTSSVWAACAGAVLFGAHPLQVESVAWVSETRGMVASVLALSALALHHGSRGRPVRAVAGLVLFVLSVLAKPSAVAAPMLAALLERRAPEGEETPSWKSILLRLAPWFLGAAAIVIVSKTLQPDDVTGWVAPIWQRPFIAGDALAFYLSKLVWPFGLAADYGRTPRVVIEAGTHWLTTLVPLALAGALILRRRWTELWGLALFAAALAPVLGLVPFAYQLVSTVADRYAYLALLGPSLLLAIGLDRAPRLRPAAGLVLLALALGARFQTAHWHDSKRLFTHIVEITPGSWTSHNNLGAQKYVEGDLEGAAYHYEQALAARTEYFHGHYNLGLVLARLGREEEAANHLQWALQLGSEYEPARIELGRVTCNLGDKALERADWKGAEQAYGLAAAVRPDYVRGHRGLARAKLASGQAAAAVTSLERAVQLEPGHLPTVVLLARALHGAGRSDAAARVLEGVLAQSPNHGGARRLLDEILTRE